MSGKQTIRIGQLRLNSIFSGVEVYHGVFS